MIRIRWAANEDRESLVDILEPIVRAGETYALPRNWTRADILDYWFASGNTVFVAEEDEEVVGSYLIRANQMGGGDHVANCGYITASRAQGRGVARQMCAHSLDYATRHGFRDMQFNFVVSSNDRAVKLWKSFGFRIVGVLPGAFLHPENGFVDVFVMHRSLQE